MSRTYRYRHGFPKPKGVEYTEARMRHRDDTLREETYHELAHELRDYPCLIGWGRWRRYYQYKADSYNYYWHEITSHRECLPGYYSYCHRDQAELLLRLRTRVQNHWRNSYMGYGSQFCGQKKWYRTNGNRRGRHHDKQHMHQLLSHGTRNLHRAYDIKMDYCGTDGCKYDGVYFYTDSHAAYDLEHELSRKHTNWDRYSLT